MFLLTGVIEMHSVTVSAQKEMSGTFPIISENSEVPVAVLVYEISSDKYFH